MKSLKRSEVEEKYTWDLSSLCSGEEDFFKGVEEIKKSRENFVNKYKDKLNTVEVIDEMIGEYEDFLIFSNRILAYPQLLINVERHNPSYQKMFGVASTISGDTVSQLSFIKNELVEKEDSLLEEIESLSDRNKSFIKKIKKAKKTYLGREIENVLSELEPVFEGPANSYTSAKHADLQFEPFTVDGVEYPLSLVLFENYYEKLSDTSIRRAAFESFSKQLAKYQHTMAAVYAEHLTIEKKISKLRGYESVIDYLLNDQDSNRELYNRQIDIIMEKFSPVIRKFASLVKRVNKLDKLTYADLKIALDPTFKEELSVEDAKPKLIQGLAVMGPEYQEMVRRAFDERWIDFPVNDGKANGAFCRTVYDLHPYVLNSWTDDLEDLIVLGHELGHAGHGMFANQRQALSSMRTSMYFIEAPSTINELLIANEMMGWKDEPEFNRFVRSAMISRTYYHNFVTHLLEAHFQREVYKLVDEEQPINANVLNELFINTLKAFWGDDVELTEGAELTWMRQIHYYIGLYPYTYSAGLTIGTQVAQRIINEGQVAVDEWIEVLKTGGTKEFTELAQMAGVDITTDKPLLDTIDYLSGIVDEIERITIELGQ